MIQVRFFAQLREQLNCDQLQWPLKAPLTAAGLRAQLIAQGDNWQALGERDVLCAINHEISSLDTKLNDNDEVAFFPPVTGG